MNNIDQSDLLKDNNGSKEIKNIEVTFNVFNGSNDEPFNVTGVQLRNIESIENQP